MLGNTEVTHNTGFTYVFVHNKHKEGICFFYQLLLCLCWFNPIWIGWVLIVYAVLLWLIAHEGLHEFNNFSMNLIFHIIKILIPSLFRVKHLSLTCPIIIIKFCYLSLCFNKFQRYPLYYCIFVLVLKHVTKLIVKNTIASVGWSSKDNLLFC